MAYTFQDKEVNVFRRFMYVWVAACIAILVVGTFVPTIVILGQPHLFNTVLIVMFTVVMAAFLIMLLVKAFNVIKTLREQSFHISFDQDDFNCLVRGGVLKVEYPGSNMNFNFILKDIGFSRMQASMDLAGAGIDTYKPHTRSYKC